MKILSAWWERAAAWSADVTISVIAVIVALRTLTLSLGLDRVMTLEVWSSPIARLVIVLCSSTAAVFAARAWFAPAQPFNDRVARWKRDRVGVWWVMGGVSVIAQAAVVGWLSEGFLGAAAEHLRGTLVSRQGVVVSLEPTVMPVNVCKCWLLVRSSSDGGALSICLVSKTRKSLAKETLKVGEAVEIDLRRTPLGLVVVSIEPTKI